MIRGNYIARQLRAPRLAWATQSAIRGFLISVGNLPRLTALSVMLVAYRRSVVTCTSRGTAMTLMKTTFATVLLLLFSIACLAQDKRTAAIKGKVRVEQGSPGGVSVILLQEDREVTRGATDKKGEFVIAHVAPGLYTVTFRKPGLAVSSIASLDLKAGKTRVLHDLVLGIDEGSIAFLRGSVFTESGRSVPGVRVELAKIVGENSLQKIDARVTGETGEFVFRLSPETAKYRVTVKAAGAEPASKDVEVDSPAVYRVALTLKPVPK